MIIYHFKELNRIDTMQSKWKSLGGKVTKAIHDGLEGFSDPWTSFDITGIQAERVKRHRYINTTGCWVTDEVLVKIEKKLFDAGAMREVRKVTETLTP